MKVDVLYNSDLIDAERAIVPIIGNLLGAGVLITQESAGLVEAHDGGLDGDSLSVLEDGLGEADGETGFAGGVRVVGGDLTEENISVVELNATIEMNVAAERGTEL
jgi:hypothetical protein